MPQSRTAFKSDFVFCPILDSIESVFDHECLCVRWHAVDDTLDRVLKTN